MTRVKLPPELKFQKLKMKNDRTSHLIARKRFKLTRRIAPRASFS